MMNCKNATESYESWLAKRTRILTSDLELKHEQMSADTFSFMRATFYRWLDLWRERCADVANAPVLLAVGDLHVENFGTWRDEEGRLVWGINDFDEAFELPYTSDLVRLAVSAHLAICADGLAVRPADACRAILKGYAAGSSIAPQRECDTASPLDVRRGQGHSLRSGRQRKAWGASPRLTIK